MKHASAVIGSNFGDEGKGLTVDWMARGYGETPTIVRFNGGAQAGHTVVAPDGRRHVFRHVGSGAFINVPTFLSSYFVCNPLVYFKELEELNKIGVHPSVFADPQCLVTTFVDVLINQKHENDRGAKRHGSCGVGFFETLYRSNEPSLSITMADLWNGNDAALRKKLLRICDEWSRFRIGEQIYKYVDIDAPVDTFINMCNAFAQAVYPAGIQACKNPIFEGAQGLLLDQNNKEYHPHLTRSNTGIKNVRELCAKMGIDDIVPYYVTRTYLTRHGAGPLPGETKTLKYEDNTNLSNSFQGDLRFAPLDTNLIKRITSDWGYSSGYNLVVTHADQHPISPEVLPIVRLVSNGPTYKDVEYRNSKVSNR